MIKIIKREGKLSQNLCKTMKQLFYILLFSFGFTACSHTPDGADTAAVASTEVQSLTGHLLVPPKEPAAVLAKKDSLLTIARNQYEENPNHLDHIIWLGRRTAYLWRYQAAIEIFTKGLVRFPDAPELYRHRGHRYLSMRKFDQAIADFEKAGQLAAGRSLEIEPDGLPNRLNTPLSNLHFNIYYHLGLAHYLKGDFAKAKAAYKTCLEWSVNPDLKVATADWLYMTCRRLGETEQADSLLATIPANLELIENDGYFNRILLYKGLKKPEDLLDFSETELDNQLNLVTQGYGVGNWFLCNGDTARAFDIFNKILETDYWSAFGYIAAEAEVFSRRSQ